MKKDDFDRLNYLSEKNIADKITSRELEELSSLLKEWNLYIEANLHKVSCKSAIK